jgi:hypothetical protein
MAITAMVWYNNHCYVAVIDITYHGINDWVSLKFPATDGRARHDVVIHSAKEALMEKPYAGDVDLPERESSWSGFGPKEMRSEADPGREFSSMAGEEHLNEARRALDDGYRLDSDPTKTVWGRVGDARRHLDAMEPESGVHAAAKDLRRRTQLRERHMEHVCADMTNRLMIRQREMVAAEMEQYYTTRGILVDIELSGQDKQFMRLACSLFREASVERIVDETRFLSHLKKAGFRRLVFDDTEENVWTYTLAAT